MDQAEVLQLFREKAEADDNSYSSPNEIIFELANLLAESKGRLSKENFDTLVAIGASMYKDGLALFRARSEVGITMQRSNDEHKNSS